jgi:integrase
LADGSVRVFYYFRPTGERLPGKPGDTDFLAAYARAAAARSRHHDGTLSALIHAWSLAPKWTDPPPPVGNGYAESTRREYRRMLLAIERRFGDLPIDALEDPAVRQDFLRWRAKVARESGAREADHRLAVLSALLSWAVAEAGEIAGNPLKGFRRLHAADRSEMIWLPEHVTAFMKTAPLEMQRALILALHTGQRQGDLLRLTWSNYDGRDITLRQGKSGYKTKVSVPCTRALKEMLDAMPRTGAMILSTKAGRPWRARHFKRQWAAATIAAGVKDLHFHDLRGTAVTMLAEAGCTTPQIAAVTGHSLRSVSTILDRYLARTRPLAEGAIALFQNAKTTRFANRLQTRPQKHTKGDRK